MKFTILDEEIEVTASMLSDALLQVYNAIQPERIDYIKAMKNNVEPTTLLQSVQGFNIYYDETASEHWRAMYKEILDDNFGRWREDHHLRDVKTHDKYITNLITPNVIVCLHFGDAVKNMYSNASDWYKYDVLSLEFKALTYDNKVNFMKNNSREEVKSIDLKMWSRQQWIKNTMHYAKLMGKRLVYVQSDWTYLKYPSMFAEAMYGDVLNSYHVGPSYFHFTGPNMDLLCVGDYNVAVSCGTLASRLGVTVLDSYMLPGDHEWLNMSDEFLLSCYRDHFPKWLFYPWEDMISKLHHPIRPINVTIKSLSKPDVTGTCTYVHELNKLMGFRNDNINVKYKIEGIDVKAIHYNIPLAYITNNDNVIVYARLLLANSPIPYYVHHYDMLFTGTILHPNIHYHQFHLTNIIF